MTINTQKLRDPWGRIEKATHGFRADARTAAEILNATDAALAQEQGGSDGD